MNKRKLNVAILSDSPFLCTGYANQATLIGNSLAEEGHNVYYLAGNYLGQTLTPPIKFEDDKILKFKVLGQGKEGYFTDLLPIYMKMYNIDVLLILFDTFMMYPKLLTLDLSPAKVIFYYPSDGGNGMPMGCEKILQFVDKPVAMAKYGQKQVKLVHNLDTDYIPHSTDTKNYYPLSEEEKLNLKKMWGLENKFVVGSVFRNQGRKMPDRIFKTFALFAKKVPNAILFLHTDPNDNAQVMDMQEIIKRYNLENRIIFSGMTFYKGFDYKKMNNIYNLMDVFLLTTSGEGFGIPIIEAMACEIPCLITNYTTTKELVINNKAGLGINLVGTTEKENPEVHTNEIIDGTLTGGWNVERGICSIKDGAKKLEWMYNNKNKIKKMGKNGRKAVLKYYNWNDVCKYKWIKIIEQMGRLY